jgi:hypothetical protein
LKKFYVDLGSFRRNGRNKRFGNNWDDRFGDRNDRFRRWSRFLGALLKMIAQARLGLVFLVAMRTRKGLLDDLYRRQAFFLFFFYFYFMGFFFFAHFFFLFPFLYYLLSLS